MIVEEGKQKMIGSHDELITLGFDANEIMQSYT